MLHNKFFNTQTVTGTHSFHKIIPTDVNVFNAYIMSDSQQSITFNVTESLFNDPLKVSQMEAMLDVHKVNST